MYSPTTRLLTVLAMLQSNQAIQGAEMARRLEVDTRTVRRYITMLQDMGVPVEAERGAQGAYYLGRGSKMPPLMFTDAEAVALTLGLIALREYNFPVDVAAVEGALAKTERALPELLLEQVRSLRESITFHVTPSPDVGTGDFLAQLSLAVSQHRRVHLAYQTPEDQITERDFDAYGIVFYETYWYTAGWCHLRNEMRTFRLDRIKSCGWVDHIFERPADFDPLAYVRRTLVTLAPKKPIKVLIKAPLDQVQQAMPFDMGILEETPEGVIFMPAAPHDEWVAQFLLYLDLPIDLLDSDDIREKLNEIIERAQALLNT